MTGLSANFSSGATTIAYRLLAAVQAPFYLCVCLSVCLSVCLAGWLAGWLVGRTDDKSTRKNNLFALASPGLRAQASGVPNSGVPSPPRLRNTTTTLLVFCTDRHVLARLLASLPYHRLGI